MRVLHLIPNYFPSIGGSQHLLQEYSERLVKLHGDHVTVFTTTALQNPGSRHVQFVSPGCEEVNGVHVHRFPFSRRWLRLFSITARLSRKIRFSPLYSSLQLLRNGPISYEMWRAVFDSDVDVIGATPFNYLQMYYPLLTRRKRPVVHFGALHLSEQDSIPRTTLWAIQRASAYIAYTQYERDKLVEADIPASRVHVIGPGVDPSRFTKGNGKRLRDKHDIGDHFLVAFIGRQTAYKGIDALLYAMQIVWQSLPEAHLLIAGTATSYSQQIGEIVKGMTEQERERIIIVDGFGEEEKPDLIAATDVCVNVSNSESFGMTYLEAWATHKPVIGSRIGAVESLITDGRNGILVPYSDHHKLASALLDLLGDKNKRESLAAAGYATLQANHTWDMVTDRLRAVYQQLL